MGDDHVPFGNEDTASRMQLQSLDEGEVVQACPGHVTSIDLHRVEDCNGSNLTVTAGLPFNRAENCFIGVILKLKSESVVVMMTGPAKGARN